MINDYDWINTIESAGANVREKDIYPKLTDWSQGLTNILEIGCGQGVCSTKVSANYTGIDPSEILFKRAKELYPDRTFLTGDANKLPFPDKTFDGVFSIAVWHLISRAFFQWEIFDHLGRSRQLRCVEKELSHDSHGWKKAHRDPQGL